MALAGALITVLCFAIRNQSALLVVAIVAVAAVVRLSNEGHTGDSSTHDLAATSIFRSRLQPWRSAVRHHTWLDWCFWAGHCTISNDTSGQDFI